MPATPSTPSDPSRIEDIQRIRRFGRFYTRRIGVVGELESELPLSEARLIFEIERLGAPSSSEVATALSLDPGYVSRQLAKLAKLGYVEKRRSAKDGRRHHLSLAPAGVELHRRLDEHADRSVTKMLEPLDGAGRRRLVGAMEDIETLLGGERDAQVRIREHGPGDLGWVLQRHGELYREFYGFDHVFESLVSKIISAFALEHDASRERLWIADAGGQRLGSVMLLAEHGPNDTGTPMQAPVARLRLFLVEPHARGRGVGTLLMETLLDFARRRGYRSMVLSTVDALDSARRIYERAGFRLIHSHPHRDWSVDVTEQEWLLDDLG